MIFKPKTECRDGSEGYRWIFEGSKTRPKGWRLLQFTAHIGENLFLTGRQGAGLDELSALGINGWAAPEPLVLVSRVSPPSDLPGVRSSPSCASLLPGL